MVCLLLNLAANWLRLDAYYERSTAISGFAYLIDDADPTVFQDPTSCHVVLGSGMRSDQLDWLHHNLGGQICFY